MNQEVIIDDHVEEQLTSELADYAAKSSAGLDEKSLSIMVNDIEALRSKQLLENTIKAGDTLPSGTLLDPFLQEYQIGNNDQSLIILFYRGGWCPYCNLELKAYQNYLTLFQEYGAQVIAISPELADASLNTQQKHDLQFTVLSDVNNEYAKKLGLVHTLTPELAALYQKFNINLAAAQGNDNNELPLPATLIITPDQKVSLIEVNEDYKLRMDPAKVVEHLKKM